LKWKIIIALLGLLYSLYWYSCDYEYYRDYREVKEELEALRDRNVQVVSIWGNEDLRLEDIFAQVVVGDGDTLGFYNLSRKSFHEPTEVAIFRFGDWEFQSCGCNGRQEVYFGGNAVVIGENGAYNLHVKHTIRNVRDAILKYEQLRPLIDSIPEYPRFGVMSDGLNGQVYFFKHRAIHNQDSLWLYSRCPCDSLYNTATLMITDDSR
jgi:hypothetical protein